MRGAVLQFAAGVNSSLRLTKVYGAGQWLEERHGVKSRRGWCKLHLALDTDRDDIIAHIMTDQDVGDASHVEPLLDQINRPICQFTADGAYDGEPTTTRSPDTAATRRSLFRHAPMRWSGRTAIPRASESVISRRSTHMEELSGRSPSATANDPW